MSSKSTKAAWTMSAPDFGASLEGLGVNLIVQDIEQSIDFVKTVLELEPTYWNEDFAVISKGAMHWMLHADHCYDGLTMSGLVKENDGVTPLRHRGSGIELHVYKQNPDRAEAKAREGGYTILTGSMDKPHGLRECNIVDPDGYCWVISSPLNAKDHS